MNCEVSETDPQFCVIAKLPSHLCSASLLSRMALLILEKGVVFENHEVERSSLETISKWQLKNGKKSYLVCCDFILLPVTMDTNKAEIKHINILNKFK